MLTVNPSEVIWTVLAFFTLLFLLKHFLYTPVSRFMDQREARIQEGLDEEKQAREAVQQQEQRLSEGREEGQREARVLLDKQKKQDEQRRAALVQEARQQARDCQTQARTEAEELRRHGGEQLAAHRQELAEALAEHLLEQGNL